MVYGDFKSPEVDEDAHPKDPKDVYGAFKLAGETIVRAYERNYGIDAVICRPSAVYGPFDSNARVIRKFIRNAMEGKAMTMDGDGSMKLDFTYVEDCAEAIALTATHPTARGLTFNVTRGEGRSLKELAEIVQTHFPGTPIEYRPKPAFMPMRGTLSIKRAREMIGYTSKIPLEEGVRRYVEHLKKHEF
jgi:nucleoside-diphosphate-sugar epimerase